MVRGNTEGIFTEWGTVGQVYTPLLVTGDSFNVEKIIISSGPFGNASGLTFKAVPHTHTVALLVPVMLIFAL